MRAGSAASLLAAILVTAAALAQKVTEGESHIVSAFISGADPRVFADGIRLGPALRQRFGERTESEKVYQALVRLAHGREVRVRTLAPEEAARHAALVGTAPDPLILLEAGELTLLMQYAPKDKRVTFVEQLSR